MEIDWTEVCKWCKKTYGECNIRSIKLGDPVPEGDEDRCEVALEMYLDEEESADE